MTQISIHQPVYLPWLGFFKKIISSDIFVFLDDVQFEKNGWHNRNKIKTKDGDIWLTVPVHAKNNILLNSIQIDNSSNWSQKHAKSILLNYSKSPFFDEYWSDYELIYKKKFTTLLELNVILIKTILKQLDVKTKIVFSSELKTTSTGSDRILEICKKLKATSYLSGIQGPNYLKTDDFKKNNIKLIIQNFHHPTYKQLYNSFLPNLSTIDLIFNEGFNARDLLDHSKNF